jgi:hypothetical protein
MLTARTDGGPSAGAPAGREIGSLRPSHLATVVSGITAFVIGACWYSPLLFGDAYMRLRAIVAGPGPVATPPIGELIAELARCVVVAYALAHFMPRAAAGGWRAGVQVGLWVWVGFQGMLLAGAVIHEGMPWELYLIHAGDALVKTLVMATILSVWRLPASGRRSAGTSA